MNTLPALTSPEQVLRWARWLLLASALVSLGVWVSRLVTHGLRPIDAGPLVLVMQGVYACWILRPFLALDALTATDGLRRERYTGWTLDGVLVMPYVLALSLYLVLLVAAPVMRGW